MDVAPSTRLAAPPFPFKLALAALALLIAVWAVGLPVDVMDIDAAQYASMAREMLERGNWLEPTFRGERYLDKPPLVFWSAAASYRLFGVGTVAFKAPSFLFALLAVVSTWGLGRRLYGSAAGIAGALVLASCQAVFLVTNDCRTDTLLMGAVALAVWQLAEAERGGGWGNLAAAAVGIGLGMLAKGPIGALVPALAVGSDIALRREWGRILRWRWFALGALAAAMLAPMVVGLWRQHGAAGVRFFFWTQSFGRVTGESPWRNEAGPLFFAHTFLWAFLPWSFAAMAGLWDWSRIALRPRGEREASARREGFCAGAVAFTSLALSMSRYKLPHYLFVVFPFAAVLTGRYLVELARQPGLASRALAWGQAALCGVLWALVGALTYYAFPAPGALLACLAAAALALAAGALSRRDRLVRLMAPSVLTMAGANLLLAGHFYPELLRYQAPSQAAHAIARAEIPPERLLCHRVRANSLDFYTRRIVPLTSTVAEVASRAAAGALWVYTDEIGVAELRAAGLDLEPISTLGDFRITMLKSRFLNPSTREAALSHRYLFRVGQSR